MEASDGTLWREPFRARGYWVSTVGREEGAVRHYIQPQDPEDKRLDPWGLFGGEGRLERLQDESAVGGSSIKPPALPEVADWFAA
jgi:hypothetical protein